MSRITPAHGVELWADIPGYEGWYEASNLGRVRYVSDVPAHGLFRGKILDGHDNGRGYLVIALRGGEESRLHFMHRLVLAAFKGQAPADKPECCHGDGSTANNVLWNLRWGSRQDNMDDRAKHAQQAMDAELMRRAL